MKARNSFRLYDVFVYCRLRQMFTPLPHPGGSAMTPKRKQVQAFAEGGQKNRQVILSAIGIFLCTAVLSLTSCNREKEPFTADQRFFVDSVSGVRIRAAQAEIDSLCKVKETTEVSRLADSLFRVRKAQMEQKLREFKQIQ